MAKLEELEIGRPSTYASIIRTITARDYVFKKGSALVPTWLAFAVTRLLEEHFPRLVDYAFTADMEETLDEIANGNAKRLAVLKDFYFGSDGAGHEGLERPGQRAWATSTPARCRRSRRSAARIPASPCAWAATAPTSRTPTATAPTSRRTCRPTS